jgi:hypothetical protein
LLWFLPAKAQQPLKLDSTGSAHHGYTLYGFFTGFDAGQSYNYTIDTGMIHLENYDPTWLRNLGSIGLPAVPVVFNPGIEPGFQWGFQQWDVWRYTKGNVRYYNTQNPYTDLNYLQGGGDLQSLQGVHTQNIRPNWNFAVTFHKMDSKGFYTNQRTVHNQVAVTSHYQSLSQRYQVLGSFIYNGFQSQENGGISDLQYFDTVGPAAQRRAPVWLNTASQRWREVDFNLSQYFFFGTDSTFTLNDSSPAKKFIQPRYFISHTFNVHRTAYIYGSGADEALYFDTAYFTESGTHDSLWQRRISNEVSVGMGGKSYRDNSLLSSGMVFPWKARVFGRYEYEQFRQPWQDTIVGNAIAGAEFKSSKPLNTSLKGEYYFAGYNQGDYHIAAQTAFYPLGKAILKQHFTLYSSLTLQKFRPGYIWEKAYTNHFRWDNEWQKSHLVDFSAGVYMYRQPKTDGWHFSLGLISLANGIYLGSDLSTKQTSVNHHYFYISGHADQKLWIFNILADVRYQKMLSGNVFRVPSFLGKASVFVEGYLFHKAMLGRAGLSLGYNSAWQPPGYIPEISAFAIQDTFRSGNYPVVDFWVAAKVKSFQFFAKLEHLNQALAGDSYFIVPYYPLEPMTWRIGIKWTFYN